MDTDADWCVPLRIGAAEGFAKGVTGGGSATPVYAKTTDQLISYLGDSTARVIVVDGTLDFTGTEGTASGTGCAPWGTASACQVAINQNGWCDNYQASAPKVSVSYDKAGQLGITVGSNKSLIGRNGATIKGKGIRLVGSKNVIIQNIAFTDINPRYVWGGDAVTLDGTDLVWIDHVTVSILFIIIIIISIPRPSVFSRTREPSTRVTQRIKILTQSKRQTSEIGRQHLVLGNSASGRVTVSNCYFDGAATYSATCDGHHYWGQYFTGSNVCFSRLLPRPYQQSVSSRIL